MTVPFGMYRMPFWHHHNLIFPADPTWHHCNADQSQGSVGFAEAACANQTRAQQGGGVWADCSHPRGLEPTTNLASSESNLWGKKRSHLPLFGKFSSFQYESTQAELCLRFCNWCKLITQIHHISWVSIQSCEFNLCAKLKY